MSFFDEIKAGAQGAVNQLGSNVQDYIKSNVQAAFVKVAAPPQGNLTPAQIAAGQTGQPPAIATPASAALTAAQSALPYLPILLGVGVLAFVLLKKRR